MDRINRAIIDWTQRQNDKSRPWPRTRCMIVTQSEMDRWWEQEAFIGPPKPQIVAPPIARAPKGLMSNLFDALIAWLRNYAN